MDYVIMSREQKSKKTLNRSVHALKSWHVHNYLIACCFYAWPSIVYNVRLTCVSPIFFKLRVITYEISPKRSIFSAINAFFHSFERVVIFKKRLQWSLTETEQQVIIVVNQVELEVIIS